MNHRTCLCFLDREVCTSFPKQTTRRQSGLRALCCSEVQQFSRRALTLFSSGHRSNFVPGKCWSYSSSLDVLVVHLLDPSADSARIVPSCYHVAGCRLQVGSVIDCCLYLSELLCCPLGWRLSIARKATWCCNFGWNPPCIVEKVTSSVVSLLFQLSICWLGYVLIFLSRISLFHPTELSCLLEESHCGFLCISCGSCLRSSAPSSIFLSNSLNWMTSSCQHCFIRIWFLDDFSYLK